VATREALAREQASVERLSNAVSYASAGKATVTVELRVKGNRTLFDVRVERLPAHGPPIKLRRVEGLSRQSLDILSTVVEAIGEVR
jgi:hypothetical protein